ncbi:hypothetical protein T484DRAFT_1979517, partial [Baffinella frigidus]
MRGALLLAALSAICIAAADAALLSSNAASLHDGRHVVAKADAPAKKEWVVQDGLPSSSKKGLAPQGSQGPLARINQAAGWLVKHMQWDFDDVDPVLPLSPLLRFEHRILPPRLPSPFKNTPVSFTTTIRATVPDVTLTSSVSPLPGLSLSATVQSDSLKPLDTPYASAGAELSVPLEAVTDNAINTLLRGALGILLGDVGDAESPPIVDVTSKLLLGISTRQPPSIGVSSEVRFESGIAKGVRARMTYDTKGNIRYSGSL